MPRDYGNVRGENHTRSKYTNDQVARAKRLLIEADHVTTIAAGEVARIAEITGISERTLSAIVQGKRWQHLPPAPATATDK